MVQKVSPSLEITLTVAPKTFLVVPMLRMVKVRPEVKPTHVGGNRVPSNLKAIRRTACVTKNAHAA
jgi:hypothetical protein